MKLFFMGIGDIFWRYLLAVFVMAYAAGILLLHACGRFPRAGLYDVSHLAGAVQLTLEGRVTGFPVTRWHQTKFVLEAKAIPLSAFQGRVAVGLAFPAWELAPGDQVRIRGWLSLPRPAGQARGFDEKGYWESRRTYAMMRVWSRPSFQVVNPASHFSLAYWPWRFHCRLNDFWFEVLPPEQAALLSGIALGTRGLLPASIKNACIRAGVYHILVVSGQKIALMVAVGLLCLRLLRVPRRYLFWISTPLIIFYALAVGADPPVTRASLMAIVVLGVAALKRDIPRYYPLFLSAGWILIREPEALLGASFQLSFAATASILTLLPLLQEQILVRRVSARWFLEAGAMGMAVHLGSWPLLIGYFHQLSLIGFLANWTLFPFSGLVLIYGLLFGAWGIVAPRHVPSVLTGGMQILLEFTLKSIAWMNGWRFASIVFDSPPWPVYGVYYLGLFCILFLTYRRKHAQNKPSDPTRWHRL